MDGENGGVLRGLRRNLGWRNGSLASWRAFSTENEVKFEIPVEFKSYRKVLCFVLPFVFPKDD